MFKIVFDVFCFQRASSHLEVVHQAVLAAALLADGEVVPELAGGVGAVHRVAHRVVLISGGVSQNARTCRRRKQHVQVNRSRIHFH